VDATQPESIQRALDQILETHGRIDHVVLAVGSILLKSAHRTSIDEWHATLNQNLNSAFYITRAVTEKMQRQPDGGSILLFSTAAAQIGFANHEAISAAKAGVEGLAKAAAASYASRKIRVNVIAPGLVDTPLARAITSNPTALEASRQMHPLGRIGTPDDIAQVAETVLLSPWMTGQVVVVDGGLAGIKK
jgi:NAD(P)-dependent dehydrogenase (short-subunit alcohol dehydrogenase family)